MQYQPDRPVSTSFLQRNDIKLFLKLVRLLQEVFEAENSAIPSKPHLLKLLDNPHFVALAAFEGEEIVGGLTAYELPMYNKEGSEMFIYDIAVKSEYQRKGLGKQLVATLEAYCKKRGIEEMFVAATEEEVHAVKFYRSIGGQGEKTRIFTFS